MWTNIRLFKYTNYTLQFSNNSIIGLLSENFRLSTKNYINSIDLPEYIKDKKYKILCSKVNIFNNKEKQQLDKFAIFGFYTELGDRIANSLCERIGFKIFLTTLFDYEISFPSSQKNTFKDPIFIHDFQNKHNHNIDSILIKKIIKIDPYFRFYFDKMLNFNMESTLELIKEKHQIILSNEIINYYLNYDEEKKHLMKTLIKN